MLSEFIVSQLKNIEICQSYLKELLNDTHPTTHACFLDGIVHCLKAHPAIAQEVVDQLAIGNADELLQLIGNSETATVEMITCVMKKFGLTLRIKLV